MSSEVKQVICIRKDLKMRRGKEIAQGSHASQAWLVQKCLMSSKKFSLSEIEEHWIMSGMTKIVCVVNSEQELLEIYNLALQKGLKAHIITDAGRTEFGGVPTKTAVAIGPNFSSDIDKITSTLTLY